MAQNIENFIPVVKYSGLNSEKAGTLTGVLDFTGANTHTGIETHTGAETHTGVETHTGAETHSGAEVFSGGLSLTSPTVGVGYATGAGGTQTQATSKATAFTLSKVSGQITTAADALAAATIVSSTWTNTTVAATDVIVLTHVSGGTVGSYTLNAQAGAGSVTLNIRNNTAGALSEALVIGFVVIKGVTA